MNLLYLSDEALKSRLTTIGKDMTAASSTRHSAMEKERMIYVKELFRRGLGGMPSKAKHRNK